MATYLVDYENVRCDDLIGISKLGEEDRVILFYSEKADKISIGLHRRILECKAAIEYRKADVGAKDALDFQLVTYLGYLIAANGSERFCVISNDLGFEYAANFWRKQKYDVRLMPSIVPFDRSHEAEPEEPAPMAEEAAAPLQETEPVSEPAESPDMSPVTETEAPEAEPELPSVPVGEVPQLLPDPAEPDPENVSKTPSPAARSHRSREGRRSARSHGAKARKPEAHKPAEPARPEEPSVEAPAADSGIITKAVAAILGEEEAGIVSDYILHYKSKLGINNALVKKYGSQRGGEIYQKIKSLIANKKGN